MVSIHRPLGYEPSTLPLRHPAISNGSRHLLTLNHGQKLLELGVETLESEFDLVNRNNDKSQKEF